MTFFLQEALQFDLVGLKEHLPRVLCWLRHLTALPRLESAATLCGFDFGKLKQALTADNAVGGEKKSLHFSKPPVQEVTEDEIELRSVSVNLGLYQYRVV